MPDTTTKPLGIAPRTVHDVADLARQNDDSIVSRTLLHAKSGSLTLFVFSEGQSLSEHTCPFDAIAHVLEGTADIVIDGVSFGINAGQMLLMPANVPHAVGAKKSCKMLLTMFKVKYGE